MRSLLAIVTLVACSEAWAQVTLPHDLQPNTKASASKVMENFRALESAIEGIGGCTATQQDNSVLIECADGTSGVLAGAGTVVIIPEGNVTGQAPDISEIPVGDFYWEDGNGVVLSLAVENMTNGEVRLLSADGREMFFHQNDSAQALFLYPPFAYIYYTESDCAGEPFTNATDKFVMRLDGAFWVATDTEISGQQTLVKSHSITDRYQGYSGAFGSYLIGPCSNYENDRLLDVGKFLVPYTPPAEWLNAASPLTLVQKP